VEGASVLLGVDGTLAGERRRASFLGRNVSVPLMVNAVGASDRIAGALADVSELLPRPLVTLERVSVCKRDGRLLRTPHELPDGDAGGLATWQKLMVYTSERAQHGGTPLHRALVTELRAAGAAGATCLRGIWGYHGDHAPHGDAFLQLHRRVPVVTIVVDTPSRTLRWFEIVDRLTAQTGLVTSELVPAFRATGAGAPRGGLRLAPPHA
jgi:PII-like signaling protein